MAFVLEKAQEKSTGVHESRHSLAPHLGLPKPISLYCSNRNGSTQSDKYARTKRVSMCAIHGVVRQELSVYDTSSHCVILASNPIASSLQTTIEVHASSAQPRIKKLPVESTITIALPASR